MIEEETILCKYFFFLTHLHKMRNERDAYGAEK